MAPNSLAGETSPYLLQHAHNPVDWRAWNRDTLDSAKSQNKPIFLSVGYSACHWCHVMAHESFENEEIARVMNEHFVNIKVDREERPDIDDIYQKACQAATGQGGWPLSVFLTPDQRPFYAGTYFPPVDSYGRPGFGSILRRLAQAWAENPADVTRAAEDFVKNLGRLDAAAAGVGNSNSNNDKSPTAKIQRDLLDEAAINLLQLGDITNGGFGGAPKFPNAANISFMFRYARLSGISKFQEFALRTLNKMARGGIFDQIGGGFHRYSTDARWLVPHFEKMLYDNALIPVNYAEAYQITGDPLYLKTMRMTLDFVLREMAPAAAPDGRGGFFSAQDADSEGQEGRFYVWDKSEIRRILGDGAETDAFCMYYDVTDGGNWEGSTILCNNIDVSTVAFQCGMDAADVRGILERGARMLLDARNTRVRPGMDDKILTSWNAMMITALARGFRVTGDRRYLRAAQNCASFIGDNLFSEGGRLLHTHKDGTSKIGGYLEDYAYYAGALLDVFEADPRPWHVSRASELADSLLDHFWDPQTNSFFMTSDEDDSSGDGGLIMRPRSHHDLSVPSGNSVAAHLLLRLYHLTRRPRYLHACERILGSWGREAAQNPFGFGYLLNTIYLYLQKPVEITVLDVDGQTTAEIARRYVPESMLVSVPSAERLASLQAAGIQFFEGKEFDDSQTVSFVCKNLSCSPRLFSVAEIASHLG